MKGGWLLVWACSVMFLITDTINPNPLIPLPQVGMEPDDRLRRCG